MRRLPSPEYARRELDRSGGRAARRDPAGPSFRRLRARSLVGLVLLLLAVMAAPAHGRPDEAMMQEFRAAYPELFAPEGGRRARPMALPDIFGPGAVLDVGNIHMKVTNFGLVGNPPPYSSLSSDPSGQWPGPTGTEYLSFVLLGVGGVNKTATDPAGVRRQSVQAEWRPRTLDPEDRMYRSYDGQVGGNRLSDDDQDSQRAAPLEKHLFVDEDFHDGRDNDGDGRIDEDFAALGQKMWSCVMWDNTQQALQTTFAERHVPLDLECRQTAWAYSVPGFQDFNVVTWTIFNRSGHPIDSMYVGLRWDMDGGPIENPNYHLDDVDVPYFPRGDFTVDLTSGSRWASKLDPKGNRQQSSHRDIPSIPAGQPLCPAVTVRVNGFSAVDNDGDEGKTPGIPSLLLLGHTIDPKGLMAPERVGWNGFRSFIAGTPYSSGGNPATDAQRAEMFESTSGISRETGFIDASPVDQEGDIQGWAMVGPFGRTVDGVAHPIPDGGSFEVTFAFAVQNGTHALVQQYPADYERYLAGLTSAEDLFAKYPALENAFAAQVAYEQGTRVVAVSDVQGAVYREDGLDVPKLVAHVVDSGSVVGFPGSEPISNEDLLELDVDVLMPAALGEVITHDNADRVRAGFVIEAANHPVTPYADAMLNDHGIVTIPDILANAGGVVGQWGWGTLAKLRSIADAWVFAGATLLLAVPLYRLARRGERAVV